MSLAIRKWQLMQSKGEELAGEGRRDAEATPQPASMETIEYDWSIENPTVN
jgi:hypothetical protein